VNFTVKTKSLVTMAC